MKSMKFFLAVMSLVCLSVSWPAFAQDQQRVAQGQQRVAPESQREYTPFMLSFVSPLQVPPRDFDVGGLRLSLVYGECRDFDGLDLGTVGHAKGHGNGLQIEVLANIVDGDGMGLQFSAVNYVKGQYSGLQAGVANYCEKGKAFQLGFYNGANYIEGLQIGAINTTQRMIGMQIGLVNVIQDNDAPFMPIINCYF